MLMRMSLPVHAGTLFLRISCVFLCYLHYMSSVICSSIRELIGIMQGEKYILDLLFS